MKDKLVIIVESQCDIANFLEAVLKRELKPAEYRIVNTITMPSGVGIHGSGQPSKVPFLEDIGYYDDFRFITHAFPEEQRDLIKKPRKHTDVPFWCKKHK